jgi:sulfotransferase
MEIFFNSSMPRAGSTLLQNILAQNPEFHVSPTSGVLELLHGARLNFSASPEFKAQKFEEVSKAFTSFCRQGLMGYYRSITNKKYIIDKSRGWLIHYNFLNSFYVNPKIICLVRDIRSVLASYERIEQQSILLSDKVDNLKLKNTTILKRAEDRLLTAPIGLSINRLYDILNQPFKDKILFLKYEDLTLNPENCLFKIYNFLNIKSYVHNFSNIEQTTQEDDEIYGIRNLHTIKSSIQPSKDYYLDILDKNFCDKIYDNFNWFFNYFNYEK